MTKPTRADHPAPFAVENQPMSEIIAALADGRVSASELTKAYLRRIEAYDRDGPALTSVREVNPG
ncbi:MAG: amidase, partial [Elsteraceae bacterium]